jgi:hypothetical protein
MVSGSTRAAQKSARSSLCSWKLSPAEPFLSAAELTLAMRSHIRPRLTMPIIVMYG